MELKFTPEVKEKWLAALRSGSYKQGYEQLVSNPDEGFRYCCLGVLADVCSAWPRVAGNEVLKDSHLGEDDYLLLDEDTQAELTKINDAKVGFPAIADYIEEQVEATDE